MSWINSFNGGGPTVWYGELGYTFQWSGNTELPARDIKFPGFRWRREETLPGFPGSDEPEYAYAYQSDLNLHFAWPTSIASLLAIWELVVVLRNKKNIDHCPTCGYDLRATPDRCPECGRLVASPVA